MKKSLLALFMAISSVYAYDIDVVDCSYVLQNDPPPYDKILYGVYKDIEEHTDNFVCAYNPCDFQHEEGWFAIRKTGSGLFIWHKNDGTTTNIYYDEKDKELVKVKFNKYGVRNDATYTWEWLYGFIDALMSGVQQCPN